MLSGVVEVGLDEGRGFDEILPMFAYTLKS